MTIMCQKCGSAAAESTVKVTYSHVVALCSICASSLSDDANQLIKDMLSLIDDLCDHTRGGQYEDGECSIVDRARLHVSRLGQSPSANGQP